MALIKIAEFACEMLCAGGFVSVLLCIIFAGILHVESLNISAIHLADDITAHQPSLGPKQLKTPSGGLIWDAEVGLYRAECAVLEAQEHV